MRSFRSRSCGTTSGLGGQCFRMRCQSCCWRKLDSIWFPRGYVICIRQQDQPLNTLYRFRKATSKLSSAATLPPDLCTSSDVIQVNTRSPTCKSLIRFSHFLISLVLINHSMSKRMASTVTKQKSLDTWTASGRLFCFVSLRSYRYRIWVGLMSYKILGALLNISVIFYAIECFVVPLNDFMMLMMRLRNLGWCPKWNKPKLSLVYSVSRL